MSSCLFITLYLPKEYWLLFEWFKEIKNPTLEFSFLRSNEFPANKPKLELGNVVLEIGFKLDSYDSYRFNFGRTGIITKDKLAYRVDILTREMKSNFDGEKRAQNWSNFFKEIKILYST